MGSRNVETVSIAAVALTSGRLTLWHRYRADAPYGETRTTRTWVTHETEKEATEIHSLSELSAIPNARFLSNVDATAAALVLAWLGRMGNVITGSFLIREYSSELPASLINKLPPSRGLT